jgi:hypothetical protein
MATAENIFLKNVRGTIGRQMVIKTYSWGTVITKYPNMSKVKPSKAQKQQRKSFGEAVVYAKALMADPERAEALKKKLEKGKSVYRAAIREFFAMKKAAT